MERHQQLVVAGPACEGWALIRTLAACLVCLSVLGAGAGVQNSAGAQSNTGTQNGAAAQSKNALPHSDSAPQLKQLFDQQKWQEVVDLAKALPSPSTDADYYEGIALAQLGQLEEARTVLLAGHALAPGDVRFFVELAGVEFKLKHPERAVTWLRQARRHNASDPYTNDFLATIYFLQGNLDAALQSWNRAGKPYLVAIQTPPELKIKPSLLDRAFVFSPEATLRLSDFLTSEARIEDLGIFPSYSFHLSARTDGKFDLALQARERDGFGGNKWIALLSTFRGAFYQTVYPEYFNLHHEGVNVTSLLRWDAQKRRAAATLSGPLWHDPKWRYRIAADLRNENWAIRPSFAGPAPALGSLNLRRALVTAGIDSLPNARLAWSTGGEISYRDYRNVLPGAALPPSVLLSGYELKHLADLRYRVLYLPEHRFELKAEGDSEFARLWSDPSRSFEKLQGGVTLHWLPIQKGDDYEIQERVRAGKTFGTSPFDELFMLGLERDSDLWLRGHIGTRDGIKGSAPLGKSYLLSNWDLSKNVYDNGLIALKLGPILDIGKIGDSSPGLATSKWLVDTGVQAKVRILGVGLVFSYGKDLRTRNNAFYATAGR